jgi:peptidoglycan/xylan/chitin deacetylase (PgdA/CDA1 family)
MTIIEYHKIGSPPPGWNPRQGWKPLWYTPEKVFVSHLAHLRENGWRVIDLADFLEGLDTPGFPSERLALLTFDDAYRSLRKVALPRLCEFGYPGVVFVPTEFIGGRNDFDRGTEPEEDICTWEDLRELNECGVSVQSHGVSHFFGLEEAQLSEEFSRSKELLESRLGISVDALAYPYGRAGTNLQRTKQLLREVGCRVAFASEGGRLTAQFDRYFLNRLAILPKTDLGTELA